MPRGHVRRGRPTILPGSLRGLSSSFPMARQKNLLEAFRNASQVETPESASSGGPFAGRRRPAAPVKPRRPRRELGEILEELALPPWLPWAAGIAVALVVGIVIGRGAGGGESQAADEADERTAAVGESSTGAGIVPRASSDGAQRPDEPDSRQAPPSAASAGDASGSAPAGVPASEAPIFDPSNRYTVVVASYSLAKEDLAWGTYDHLQSHGIPVFNPMAVAGDIVVLAGAAPEYDDLKNLEERVRKLARGKQSNVYGDAYRRKIDSLIRR